MSVIFLKIYLRLPARYYSEDLCFLNVILEEKIEFVRKVLQFSQILVFKQRFGPRFYQTEGVGRFGQKNGVAQFN